MVQKDYGIIHLRYAVALIEYMIVSLIYVVVHKDYGIVHLRYIIFQKEYVLGQIVYPIGKTGDGNGRNVYKRGDRLYIMMHEVHVRLHKLSATRQKA